MPPATQTTYGKLTTSKDSVTQVLPEDDGTTLAERTPYTDNSLYNNGSFPHYQGVIKMLGETIVHDGQAIAPGGRIVVGKEYVTQRRQPPAVHSTGRVYLGAGSVLSTAGLWVDLPYVVQLSDDFKLGSRDLADSPLQKGGFLINQTRDGGHPQGLAPVVRHRRARSATCGARCWRRPPPAAPSP